MLKYLLGVGRVGLVIALLTSPAWGIYQSTFDEPLYTMNAFVVGQDGWTSTTGTNKIWVDVWDGAQGGTLQLNPPASGANRVADHTLNADNPTGITTVQVDMYPGIGLGGNTWTWYIQSSTGAVASWWYGGIDVAQARVGGTATAVPGGITGRTTLKSVIDIAAGSTSYYYDKHDGNGEQLLVTYAGYTATSADKIQFQSTVRDSTFVDTWNVFDNLNIPEPATLVLLSLGGLLTLRRKRA
jgi:hypothetical protein